MERHVNGSTNPNCVWHDWEIAEQIGFQYKQELHDTVWWRDASLFHVLRALAALHEFGELEDIAEDDVRNLTDNELQEKIYQSVATDYRIETGDYEDLKSEETRIREFVEDTFVIPSLRA